jgi:hypothetical protein
MASKRSMQQCRISENDYASRDTNSSISLLRRSSSKGVDSIANGSMRYSVWCVVYAR